MATIINLEENIGKTVGKRQPPADALMSHMRTVEESRRWKATFGGLRIPKGLHRFKTHEEADQWLWKNRQTLREKDIPDRLFLRQALEAEGIPLDPPPSAAADPLAGIPRWLRWVVRRLEKK